MHRAIRPSGRLEARFNPGLETGGPARDPCKNWRIGGKTPYEACLSWSAKQPQLFIMEPSALLAHRPQSCDT